MARSVWIGLLAGLVTLASITVSSAQLPDDFAIRALRIKSDDNLGAKRIGCAFGDTPKIMRKFAREYPRHAHIIPDIADYCTAVLREAMRRKRWANLYSRMQPKRATAELKLILSAAGTGKRQYKNAAGTIKVLNCELAFDAGYVAGALNPKGTLGKRLPRKKIRTVTSACFLQAATVSTSDAVVAGFQLSKEQAVR